MCKFASSCILFLLNSLVALIGIAVLVVGAISTWNKQWITDILKSQSGQINEKVAEVIEQSLLRYGLFIFIIGIIIFVISFCGCCGVWCKNRLLLGIYAACIVVMALVLLIGLIVLGVMRQKLPQLFEQGLKDLSESDKHSMEFTLKCCGISDAKAEYGDKYPDSCCNTKPCTATNSYNKTCSQAIGDLMSSNYNYLLIAAGVLCAIFIVLAGISIYLLKRYSASQEI